MNKKSWQELIPEILPLSKEERRKVFYGWWSTLTPDEKVQARAEIKQMVDAIIETTRPLIDSIGLAMGSLADAFNRVIDNHPGFAEQLAQAASVNQIRNR